MTRDAFVEEVLTPLVRGTTMTVRAPLDADDVGDLVEGVGALSGIAEFLESRRRVASQLLYHAELPGLDADAIRIGAAVHNLCWLLTQPHKDNPRGALLRVAEYTTRLARLAAPADEVAVIARHALVAGLRTMWRSDVRVRFWAGEQTFLGAEPPRRLMRWQSVRRVHEERTTTQLFGEALQAPHGASIVTALLHSSPLTDLLLIQRSSPPVELRRAAAWLAAPHVARLVADDYLAQGLGVREAPLADALLALYGLEHAEPEATVATAFHSHLHLLDLVARAPRDREGHLQIVRGYVQGRDRAAADGFGIHAAATGLGLGAPPDLGRDAILARNAAAYAEACAELVGMRRLLELTSLVARGAGRAVRVS